MVEEMWETDGTEAWKSLGAWTLLDFINCLHFPGCIPLVTCPETQLETRILNEIRFSNEI